MTDRREFRKEVREYVKDAKSTCEAVRKAAHEYWLLCNQRAAGAAAVTLKAEVGNLARHIQILTTLGLDIPSDVMADVRQAATGGDFEKKARKRTPDDQGRMADVAGSLQDLVSAIDNAFYRHFQPNRRHQWMRYIPLLSVLFVAKDG
ncbi:hypothetical protein [Sphingobium chungangianum]